jgi:replicative DNA helicase
MPTGFLTLDNVIGGFSEGEFIIVGGRPAMGKTLFLLQTGLNMSKKCPVLFLSYDLTEYPLTCRILSILSGIDLRGIENNPLTEDEKIKLELSKNELDNYQLIINTNACNSIDTITEYCVQQIKNQGVKIIIVDYLQLLNHKNFRHSNREAEIDEICKKLKNLAKEYKVCIISASSINRNIEGRGGKDGKRPQLSDLSKNGGIEQMADKILLLYRPNYYKIFEDDYGNPLTFVLEVIVAKNIGGTTGNIQLSLRNNCIKSLSSQK